MLIVRELLVEPLVGVRWGFRDVVVSGRRGLALTSFRISIARLKVNTNKLPLWETWDRWHDGRMDTGRGVSQRRMDFDGNSSGLLARSVGHTSMTNKDLNLLGFMQSYLCAAYFSCLSRCRMRQRWDVLLRVFRIIILECMRKYDASENVIYVREDRINTRSRNLPIKFVSKSVLHWCSASPSADWFSSRPII